MCSTLTERKNNKLYIVQMYSKSYTIYTFKAFELLDIKQNTLGNYKKYSFALTYF
jgi:hypothetical protein